MNTEQTPFVVAEGLTLKTPSGYVYRDVSMQVGKGKVCCLFGSEGCGKTSLLLTLCGRMKPSSGSNSVAGLDSSKNHRKVRNMSNITIVEGVNDVPENLKCSDIVGSELMLCGRSGRKAKVEEYLKEWDCTDLANKRYRDLDSYESALFGILLACCGEPNLLMVDDVQNGLTQHQSIKLVKLLKNMAQSTDVTVFFGCGEYEIARYADGIVVLSDDAEAQRQAVLAEGGTNIALFGVGNNVEISSRAQAVNTDAAETKAFTAVAMPADAAEKGDA